MRTYNFFGFEGWLGTDAPLKKSSNGTAYKQLWVTRTERWNDKTTGEKREKQTSINVTLFGEQAEKFTGVQGDRVRVLGEITTEEYQGKKKNGFKADQVDVTMTKQQRVELNKPANGSEDDNLPF
jgi:single-stranded DNA-binding protein